MGFGLKLLPEEYKKKIGNILFEVFKSYMRQSNGVGHFKISIQNVLQWILLFLPSILEPTVLPHAVNTVYIEIEEKLW